MTEAASLNFGPAWLRDSFTSNSAGEGPPGSGSGGGGTMNSSHSGGHQQNSNSGWDIASSSRSSHGGHPGGRSVGGQPQSNPQSNFQMNLHVEGQHSSGTSAMLSAMKLGKNKSLNYHFTEIGVRLKKEMPNYSTFLNNFS